jgi:hypothetical protein
VAGLHGDPLLVGSGTPAPKENVTLDLSNARENATAYLFIGISTPDDVTGLANSHYHGGVFVPEIDVLVGPFSTSGVGTLSLSDDWTANLPAFTQLYFQYWIIDAAGIGNQAGSNAVQCTIP